MIFDDHGSDHKPNPRGHTSPLVEAITKHKGEWTVHDMPDSGVTDNASHIMWVPHGNEVCRCGKSHSDAIRGHELLHSKLSPEERRPITVKFDGKAVRVSETNIVAAEEHRINASLQRLEGSSKLAEMFCEPSLTQLVGSLMDKGDYSEIMRLNVMAPGLSRLTQEALAQYGADLAKVSKANRDDEKMQETISRKTKVASALGEAVPHYDLAAQRIMATSTKLPGWHRTEQLAAFLEVNLANLKDQIAKLLAEPLDDEGSDLKIPYAKPSEPSLEPEVTVSKPRTPSTPSFEGRKTGGFRWGKDYETTEAEMPLALPPWKIHRRNRAVDEGSTPRYMHRYMTDKRVFHRTKKIPGGSILVDDSGSMGLNPRELDAILDQAPVATVAVYAGGDGQDGGEIRVVAKDGKRARDRDLSIEHWGGNGIDGPALEWLAQQPYPRIWISDGYVTGVNGNFGTPGVWDSVKRFCIKNRITRAERPKDAVEMLTTGKYAR